MNVHIIEKQGKKYLELIPGKILIQNEEDIVDVIGLCGVHRTNLVMLYDENLTEDFFDLKTCMAGNILQKCATYRIKVAALLSPDKIKGKFKEMVSEANKASDFRVFFDRKKAEDWLMTIYRWPIV